MARMKALSESHRVLELERKLFAVENALKQGRIDMIKLQVKIEELQMKYEPNGKTIHRRIATSQLFYILYRPYVLHSYTCAQIYLFLKR